MRKNPYREMEKILRSSRNGLEKVKPLTTTRKRCLARRSASTVPMKRVSILRIMVATIRPLMVTTRKFRKSRRCSTRVGRSVLILTSSIISVKKSGVTMTTLMTSVPRDGHKKYLKVSWPVKKVKTRYVTISGLARRTSGRRPRKSPR